MVSVDKKYIDDYNRLIQVMAEDIKEIFLVLSCEDNEILYKNKKAVNFNDEFPIMMKHIIKMISEKNTNEGENFELLCQNSEHCDLVYNINRYNIYWGNKPACAYKIEDITDNTKYKQSFEKTLFTDLQTGVYNRRYCQKKLNELIDNKCKFVVSFIDMDNLNYVNDRFGYEEGDRYIKSLVDVFFDTFRKTDAVCRIGGDEFIVIMPNCPENLAVVRLEEARRKMSEIKSDYNMSFSYGNILVDSDNMLSRDDILKMADKKMYEFKRINKILL